MKVYKEVFHKGHCLCKGRLEHGLSLIERFGSCLSALKKTERYSIQRKFRLEAVKKCKSEAGQCVCQPSLRNYREIGLAEFCTACDNVSQMRQFGDRPAITPYEVLGLASLGSVGWHVLAKESLQ